MSITMSEALSNLLASHGIADSYIGYAGESVEIPIQNRIAILAHKGIDVLDSQGQLDGKSISQALDILQKQHWQSLLPAVQIEWRTGADLPVNLSIPLRVPVELVNLQFLWTLVTEQGERHQGKFKPAELALKCDSTLGQVSYQERDLQLTDINASDLPAGYHQLSVSAVKENQASDLHSTMSLVIAPPRCHEPDWASNHQRLWGFSVQLYSIRSEKNWGIGDFGDLAELTRLAAAHGADYLILNPLHAGDAAHPAQCSPYSPSDRRRLNPLYLDVSHEQDFLACLEADISLHKTLEPLIEQLNHAALVDYTAVSEVKYRVFSKMYQMFLQKHAQHNTTRFQSYQQYLQTEKQGLEQYVRWQATTPVRDAEPFSDNPDFYAYLQWLTECQFEKCQQLSVSLGMKLGLIRDLAVGSDVNGAEVLMNPQTFCRTASIGAPPDPLAPQGQNWGLPPLDPQELQSSAYAHFIDLLRTNMSHCGALRIDHVMSLMRLWWCTAGGDSGQGAYVHYPVRELFALLCLESQRNSCLIIGEDLGVVPPEVRHYLGASGVFSNILFYFEKYDGVHFRRPEHYPKKALCMVANHDVPPLTAWWNGSDLTLRRELGLIVEDAELQLQMQARRRELQQVCRWLEAQWLLPAKRFDEGAEADFDQPMAAAIVQCCARSMSQMLSIQLEDLVLESTPVNIPGTSTEYPNWRRKLPLAVWDALTAQAGNPMINAIRLERQ